jgi:ubiquinone/menaquinone biosynthesis C-methylase UbiE
VLHNKVTDFADGADAKQGGIDMETFTRDDGRVLRVIEGYRERVLGERPTYSPRPDWSNQQYAAAAGKKLQRTRRFLAEFERRGGQVQGARILDVACGDAINCLLIALQPVREVVGIDLELPLLERVERWERTNALAAAVCKLAGLDGKTESILEELPLRLRKMDATAMEFADDSFDFLISRSAIEHIMPVEKAFAEMARVVRPSGLIHLSTDPYFSPRGCHKTGVVDIPWAHARLSLEEYRQFVTESEGEDRAVRRCRRLETLNPYTIRQWREKIEAGPFEVLEWNEEISRLAGTLLEEYPEVRETVLEGVEDRDLVHGRLNVWLRKRCGE